MNAPAAPATPIIAGNWKMHMDPRETRDFFAAFLAASPPRRNGSVIFFPPAISLAAAREATSSRPDIGLGVQNIHWEKSGAFTGEISAGMAAESGARFALIGHSERRHIFGETDAQVGRKAAAALAANLTPVLCVGETLEERRSGQLETVLERQLTAALHSIDASAISSVVLAYEPVWAIGTGVNATPSDASAAHAFIHKTLTRPFGPDARNVPILYGGSVKPDNAAALLAAPHVDGLLVGGASLDPAGFARIAQSSGPADQGKPAGHLPHRTD